MRGLGEVGDRVDRGHWGVLGALGFLGRSGRSCFRGVTWSACCVERWENPREELLGEV